MAIFALPQAGEGIAPFTLQCEWGSICGNLIVPCCLLFFLLMAHELYAKRSVTVTLEAALVAVLLGDLAVDVVQAISDAIDEQNKGTYNWAGRSWALAFVLPVMLIGSNLYLFIKHSGGLKRFFKKRAGGFFSLEFTSMSGSLRDFFHSGDISLSFEFYSFLLTVTANLMYVILTNATGAFRYMDAEPKSDDDVVYYALNDRCPMDAGLRESTWTVFEFLNVALPLDFFVRFLLAPRRLAFFFTPYAMADFLSISNLPIWIFELGLEQAPSFGFLKYLRLIRVVNLKFVKDHMDPLYHSLLRLAVTLSALFFVLAGISLALEFPRDVTDEGHSPFICFHDSLYFAVVTLTTVGFGDMSPATGTGRMLCGLLIILGVGIVSVQITELVEVLAMFSPYKGSYLPSKSDRHCIVIGRVSAESFGTFLQEFFHPNHGQAMPGDRSASSKRLFLLSPDPPSAGMKELLQEWDTVRFFQAAGSTPLEMASDLKRVGFADPRCSGVFILSDRESRSPSLEDSNSILWTIVVKKNIPLLRAGFPAIPLIVQVILPENKAHVKNALTMHDLVVCAADVKYNLLAQSFYCMGLSTLVGNLIRSCDYSGTQYAAGCDWEIYVVPLDPHFMNHSFRDCVQIVWHETVKKAEAEIEEARAAAEAEGTQLDAKFEDGARGVLLIGVKQAASTSEDDVLLNPGGDYMIADGDMAVVLATDSEAAAILDEWPGAELPEPRRRGSLTEAGFELGAMPFSPRPPGVAARSDEQRDPAAAGAGATTPTPTHLKEVVRATSLAQSHVVLCGAPSGLRHLVGCLRAGGSAHPEIVLIHEGPLAEPWVARTANLTVVDGSPREVASHDEARSADASMVIITADCIEQPSELMADAETLKITRCVQAVCKSNPANRVFVISEVIDPNHVVFFETTSWWPEARGDAASSSEAETDYALAPIFAAGQVFSTSMLDTLLCQAFYNGSIVQILERCFQGPSALRHVPVPAEFVQRTYGELFDFMLAHDLVPLAIYAHRNSPASRQMLENEATQAAARVSIFAKLGNAPRNPQGRRRSASLERGGAAFGCVVTNPPPETRLFRNDLIIVAPSSYSAVTSLEEDLTVSDSGVELALSSAGASAGSDRAEEDPGEDGKDEEEPLVYAD